MTQEHVKNHTDKRSPKKNSNRWDICQLRIAQALRNFDHWMVLNQTPFVKVTYVRALANA